MAPRIGLSQTKVDFEEGIVPDLLARCPVMLVGCKKDLVEANKA
jgi:hypothetical protein